VYSDVHLGCCRFALSVPQPSDCLERLVPEMSHYVLKETHSHSPLVCPMTMMLRFVSISILQH